MHPKNILVIAALTVLAHALPQATAEANAGEERRLAAQATGAERMGVSLAISDNRVIVGAHLEDHNGVLDAGAAYIFVRDGENWLQEFKLSPPDEDSHHFGGTVALDGDTALVRAKDKVHVFARSGDTWSQQAVLAPEEGSVGGFGYALAIVGDTAVIGAPWSDDYRGAVYVYVRNDGQWRQQTRLQPAEARPNGYFGAALALTETTALVGAYGDSEAGFGCGSAYVYARSGATWLEEAVLQEEEPEEDHFFGYSLDLSNDTALIGNLGGPSMIFVRNAEGWSPEAEIARSSTELSGFGYAVALMDDTALIGAPFASATSGSAYVYRRTAGVWNAAESFAAGPRGQENLLGTSVGLSAQFAIVGAPQDGDSGAAYLFSVDPDGEVPPSSNGACSVGSGQSSPLGAILPILLLLMLGRWTQSARCAAGCASELALRNGLRKPSP